MNFVGNEKIIEQLSNSLKRGNLNHAYIFSGPESVGKFQAAKMFAQAAILGKELNRTVDQMDKDALLDLIFVEPEIVEKKGVSKQRDISIETIREAKQGLSLFPYQGKYKILIVNDAHKLNVAAQNALLKILEEPNQTSMLILVTNEIERILPTILSRCQLLNFGLVGEEELGKNFSKEITSLAIGRPGFAKALETQQEQKEVQIKTKSELDKILHGTLTEKFVLAEELSKNVTKTLEKLAILMWEMRKMALAASQNEQVQIFSKIEKVQNSINVLKRSNANGRLVLETLFMDL